MDREGPVECFGVGAPRCTYIHIVVYRRYMRFHSVFHGNPPFNVSGSVFGYRDDMSDRNLAEQTVE